MDAQLELSRKSARERLLATAFSSATTGVGLALLVWFVVEGRLTAADAAAAGYAMQRIQSWLAGSLRNVTSLYDGAYFLDDYAAFLALGAQVEATRPTATVAGPFGELRAEGLGFTYPGSTATGARRDRSHDPAWRGRRARRRERVGEDDAGQAAGGVVLAGRGPGDVGRRRAGDGRRGVASASTWP